ncbi:MAG: PQQ-binding-like beta-propeller repeat protein [Trebonia sp.]
MSTATGAVRRIGALPVAVHDAAVAVSGQRALVFGGGSAASVGTVQSFPLAGGGAATDIGNLPAPRSDAQAATIGATTYIVGGFDGSKPDASVVATTNGQTYRIIATLRVPVRYAAVAALDGRIYAFGGEAITGPHAGTPVNVIQVVDPARRTASIVGNLPEALAGAAAVTVDGELFVAGGESPAATKPTPGLGTTQLTGQPIANAGSEGPSSPTRTVSTIWAYDPATGRLLSAGRLQVPVSNAGVAADGSIAWIVGGESNGARVSSVQMIRPDRAFGTAGAAGAGSPYFGDKLLVADRGNNRLLLLDAAMNVVWRYPSPSAPRDKLGFYFPDDAFFTNHGTAIISNQEENETIVKIAYPSGKIVWSYGHPGQPGTARGYLHEPDDAYLLKNGQVTVADAVNCRVLVINENHTVARQIGTDGECFHNPPASMGSPNGDTPLTDGNLLISEINASWVSEYTPAGKLVWTVHLAVVGYPSDPQQTGPDSYLLADYSSPGQVVEFDRHGKILYRYDQASGPGRLDHPSLAELLPSGVIIANDDHNDRMVAIDPSTGALVWQYGITGKPGTGPGQLNIPDGFDLLLPDGSTPTHPATG